MTASAIAVHEGPILMSGPMVRASLRDIDPKTQTRRIIDPQPIKAPAGRYEPHDPFAHADGVTWGWMCGEVSYTYNDVRCRYGAAGDRLWVRETLRRDDGWRYDADRSKALWSDHHARPQEVVAWYDRQEARRRNVCVSIHMPRWASRMTLELINIRAERLRSITSEDAAREGLTRLSKDGGRTWKYGIPDRDGWPGTDNDGWQWADWCVSPVEAYAKLWDSLNAKRGFGWALNPWVWVLDYRRVCEVASA